MTSPHRTLHRPHWTEPCDHWAYLFAGVGIGIVIMLVLWGVLWLGV